MAQLGAHAEAAPGPALPELANVPWRERQSPRQLEPGGLGIWLVGEAGALLVNAGGRRVHCFCVGTTDPELPPSDRIAHLLLALRSDEIGFATVANHAYSGAIWRIRRRLPKPMRPAHDAARQAAKQLDE